MNNYCVCVKNKCMCNSSCLKKLFCITFISFGALLFIYYVILINLI